MENCTVATEDGSRICYVSVPVYVELPASDYFSLLRHDAWVAFKAVVLTCLAMAAYNLYLDWQIRSTKKGRKDKDTNATAAAAANDERTSLLAKQMLLADGSKGSRSRRLAYVDGVEASGTFLSAVFSQIWEHLNVAVSSTIKDSLDSTLKELRPVSLHFVTLDLGNVPIQTKNMFIHRVDLERKAVDGGAGEKKAAGIQIDFDVEWDGNCNILLQANLTKSAKVTFGVKHIKLKGRMHVLLSPLTTELPVVSAVQYGFTNPPDVQLEFAGAVCRVTDKLAFAQSALVSAIQSAMAGALVLPRRMVMPVDLGSYDYLDAYRPPVGMVRIAAVKGRGFKILQKTILKDIPDIYCLLSLGASGIDGPKFRTSTQYDNLSPEWTNESCDFVLYDLDQKVYVEAMDEDKTPVDPDDELGKAAITVRELFRNGGTAEVELELEGERTGCYITLSAELFHLSTGLGSLSSPAYCQKSRLCGLLTIIVTKAFDVPLPREVAATYVKVTYGEGSKHEKVFYTGTVTDYPGIDALNPMYDCVFHVPLKAAMLQPEPNDEMTSLVDSKESPSPEIRNGDSPKLSGSSTRRTAKRGSFLGGSLASSWRVVGVSRYSLDCRTNDVTFALIDAEAPKGKNELGKMILTHRELTRAYGHATTETRAIGDRGARLEFRVVLNGIQSEEEKMQADDSPQSLLSPEVLSKSLYGGTEERLSIRVTIVRGRGFKIRKRRLGKKDDMPDVYCNIRLASSRRDVSTWRTPTIKDDTMPQWNESRNFEGVDHNRDKVVVEAYEENRGGQDEYLGKAEFLVEKLLRKRLQEIELWNQLSPTGAHIMLRCIQLGRTANCSDGINANSTVDNKEVLVHYHPQMGDEGFESTLLPDSNAAINSNNASTTTTGAADDGDNEEHDDDVVMPLSSANSGPSRISDLTAVSIDDDDTSLNSMNSTSSTSSRRKILNSMGKLSKRMKKPSILGKKKKEKG